MQINGIIKKLKHRCCIILLKKDGNNLEKLLVIITFACSALALTFALFTAFKVLKFPEGTEKMKQISQFIRKGANAYLKRQY